MHTLTCTFTPLRQPLRGQAVTARGLHGLFYHVLKQHDPQAAGWLHAHPAPKPYTLVPYYQEPDGVLAGLRITTLSEQATDVVWPAWEQAYHTGRELFLGSQTFTLHNLAQTPGPSFAQLATLPPGRDCALRFLSPTNFRQGAGNLPLPMPANVFQRPFLCWQAFAAAPLRLPGDWPDWCAANLFITAHRIETVSVTIDPRNPPFVGFVGDVRYTAQNNDPLYLSIFQALAQLAPYSGTGYKTTMGMGAVALLETP